MKVQTKINDKCTLFSVIQVPNPGLCNINQFCYNGKIVCFINICFNRFTPTNAIKTLRSKGARKYKENHYEGKIKIKEIELTIQKMID